MRPGSIAWRYTSPALIDDDALYECPVGMLLREAPHVYDLIDACVLVENATPSEYLTMPRYFQHASRVYRSELARLDDLRQQARKSGADINYARRRLQAG